MINGRGKKKKQSSDAQICFQFLDFSLIFAVLCEILDTFTSLSLEQIFNHLSRWQNW